MLRYCRNTTGAGYLIRRGHQHQHQRPRPPPPPPQQHGGRGGGGVTHSAFRSDRSNHSNLYGRSMGMGMEELSSDSEDGSGQPSHIARYEQWLEQKATRPPSPPPPPRTSESRTGLAKEPASSTTNSGPAEEQPGKVPTRTLACLHACTTAHATRPSAHVHFYPRTP